MRDVILARLSDQDPLIITEVYTNSSALLSSIPPSTLLPIILSSLKTSSVPRSVLRSHFAFLGRDFSAKHSELVLSVFEEAFYPFLLITKPRQKTSTLAWGVVGDSHLGQLEILNGCVEAIAGFDLFSGADEKDKEREAGRMAGANIAMAEKLTSTSYTRFATMSRVGSNYQDVSRSYRQYHRINRVRAPFSVPTRQTC